MLRYGDKVLVYIDDKRKYLITLKEDGILGTDRGFIYHKDIIGREYGEVISTSRGFKAYILEPLPRDFLHGFRRVTQVIYPKDSSYMIYLAGLKPGSTVLEAGVGTGFLTLSIAYVIGCNGRIYGFDINEKHITTARINLELAGVLDRVVLINSDVREPDILAPNTIDAVFYDLPDPWNALETAYSVLKPSKPMIVYVPTINQVEKIVLAMRKSKCFIEVNALEILEREYNVSENATRPRTLMIGHTGYIVYGRKIIDPKCVLQ